MPGLVPGIHVLSLTDKKDVDGRDRPGHDEPENPSNKGATRFPLQLFKQRVLVIASVSDPASLALPALPGMSPAQRMRAETEAIQTEARSKVWIASSLALLAMTHPARTSAFPRRDPPESCMNVSPD